MRKAIKNNNGFAMLSSLFFSVILIGLSGMFVLRVVSEVNSANKELTTSQSELVAQAATQSAIDQLDVMINTYLNDTISSSSSSGVISYTSNKVSSGEGVEWLVFSVRNSGVPVLAQNGEEAVYADSSSLNGFNYSYEIIITEKEDPSTSGPETWDFPYAYRINATSAVAGVSQQASVFGDFTVRVQKDNFAKYALFTNSQTTPSGGTVWFTDKTNFAGPVHTNGRFNFAFNPSGTFHQSIAQKYNFARFYNDGWPVLMNSSQNGTKDVPVFHSMFNRGASAVTLNTSTIEDDMVEQTQGSGGGSYGSNGIYVPANGPNLKGGIFVKGSSDITMSVESNNAVYTIAQGGTTKKITVDPVNSRTTVYDVDSGSTTSYNGVPSGKDGAGTLIYVDGNINNLSGSVQADTGVTIASSNDVVISGNVTYSDYTSGVGDPSSVGYVPPNAVGANNLLGLVSWNGDVRIGTSAPDNVQVHGTILAMNGVFQVDNYYDSGVGPRGTATLLGGVISDNYGAFGQFSGATGNQISGYGRNFVYDTRMSGGSAPPYFPSLQTFIAFTNDIADKLVWIEGK